MSPADPGQLRSIWLGLSHPRSPQVMVAKLRWVNRYKSRVSSGNNAQGTDSSDHHRGPAAEREAGGAQPQFLTASGVRLRELESGGEVADTLEHSDRRRSESAGGVRKSSGAFERPPCRTRSQRPRGSNAVSSEVWIPRSCASASSAAAGSPSRASRTSAPARCSVRQWKTPSPISSARSAGRVQAEAP